MKKGTSLVELLVYIGLLSIIVVVLYDIFVVTGYSKISEIAYQELTSNANSIITQVSYSVKTAESIQAPAAGVIGPVLRLNGGLTEFSLNENGQLVKSEGGVSEPVHTDAFIIDSISFQQVAPSAISPSIIVVFTGHSRHEVQGHPVSKEFRTAVSLRN